MATKRSIVQQDDPAPEPPAEGTVAVPPPPAAITAPPPMPLIGVACDPMTPGWLMGIGKAPETAAEHATRLGAAAGTYRDAGALLGTLEPRSAWPAFPLVEPPPEEP